MVTFLTVFALLAYISVIYIILRDATPFKRSWSTVVDVTIAVGWPITAIAMATSMLVFSLWVYWSKCA